MFAVIGEALLDMVQPAPGEPYVARPGGGPLNIAVGLRRLGYDTHLMARLSTGRLGEVVRVHIEDNQLDTAACVDTTDKTTLAFASVDHHGRASYTFYVEGTADWGWSADELERLPAAARVVHTGSLATALAPGAAAIADLYGRLSAEGERLLSYDPNIRPALVGGRKQAVAQVERFVASSHVVKASDEDLGWLYPGVASDDILRRWLARGPALVVLTVGPDGCRAMTRAGDVADVPGLAVQVEDTIGAGDAFQSGLLAGLVDARATNPGALSTLGGDALISVLRRATRVAALTCQRAGADPPTDSEYASASA